MLTRNYRRQTLKVRIITLLLATILFIISFVMNIVLPTAAYNADLNFVPVLQNNSVLGSKGFLTFMNLVSLLFDPNICAGYIFLIYLVSYRKLQIINFLIWFFFLSWLLGILKLSIQQPRPFWLSYSTVKMQSWTCYTDYGCPSGHSMLAIVLLQFFVRFYARVNKCVYNYIWIFYIIIFLLELLVMFSRMMLGMHTLNEVLFGLSIGLFSFIPYYLFVENLIMQILLKIFVNSRSIITTGISLLVMSIFLAISVIVALVPEYYSTQEYYQHIKTFSGCSSVKKFKSFQYGCLIGTSIVSAAFGAIIGMNYMKKPHNLIAALGYSRISIKFILRFFLIIVMGAIPLAIFMNPLWQKIKTSTQGMALIQWGISNLAFFFATFMIVFMTQMVGQHVGLQLFVYPSSYSQFKKFQSVDILAIQQSQFIKFNSPVKARQTEMIDPRNSDMNSNYM